MINCIELNCGSGSAASASCSELAGAGAAMIASSSSSIHVSECPATSIHDIMVTCSCTRAHAVNQTWGGNIRRKPSPRQGLSSPQGRASIFELNSSGIGALPTTRRSDRSTVRLRAGKGLGGVSEQRLQARMNAREGLGRIAEAMGSGAPARSDFEGPPLALQRKFFFRKRKGNGAGKATRRAKSD